MMFGEWGTKDHEESIRIIHRALDASITFVDTADVYSAGGRAYDLRHAAVSLWLNAGVPATDVASRAGHSVEVLLRVYAKCLDDGETVANQRINAALHGA
jgi:integrase